MRLFTLGAGVAIGYIMGSKRGQAQFERTLETVKQNAAEAWKDPKVQDTVSKAGETAKKYASTAADSVKKQANEVTENAADTAKSVAAKAEDTVKKSSDSSGFGSSATSSSTSSTPSAAPSGSSNNTAGNK